MTAAVPEPIRFHLDEHMPRALARALQAKGIDVTTTPEAGLLESEDEEQLAYSMRERRVVVTMIQTFFVWLVPCRITQGSPTATGWL